MTGEVEFLHELEREDEELGAQLTGLDGLAHEVEEIGARTTVLLDRLSRLPGERTAAAEVCAAAEHEVEVRRTEHERILAVSYRDEAEARRDEVRARDLLHSSERTAEAAKATVLHLAGEADEVAREAQELATRANDADVDPPADATLEAIAAWATETRATLFVRRAQVAAQREAAIRQANELGSALLGEPLVAQSAALVARRVEEAAS